jgi:hypothetical protein
MDSLRVIEQQEILLQRVAINNPGWNPGAARASIFAFKPGRVLAAIGILSVLVGTRTGAEQATDTGDATWR